MSQPTREEKILDYLIKFRRAQNAETLEIMADAAERKHPEDDMFIAQAFVQREQEMENAGAAGTF
jgi:hypothetical protein